MNEYLLGEVSSATRENARALRELKSELQSVKRHLVASNVLSLIKDGVYSSSETKELLLAVKQIYPIDEVKKLLK